MRVKTFFRNNSLTIFFVGIMLLALFGQFFSGWKVYNDHLSEEGLLPVGVAGYFHSGHFLQATFENWESEFLQMGLFVIITIFLRQKGSSESKPVDDTEDCDKPPKASPGSPWPVRKGGIWLALYKHSLSVAFILLFLFSFIMHFYGSWIDYNEEQSIKNEAQIKLLSYLTHSKFWFESFQNWQSEFLAVASIVFLSIYLRQYKSPQSKSVDAPHHANK